MAFLEILDLFEPIVFQYVLRTRVDTGNARKAIGLDFARQVGSQRIIDATEYDVEVSHELYNHWKFESDDNWSGICNILVESKKLSVLINASDYGLYAQESLWETPSTGQPDYENWMDKNRPDNTVKRMPPNHISLVSSIINGSNLEFVNNEYILPRISKDIKQSVQAIVNKIETELFKK